MEEKQLQAIEERWATATPGPWESHYCGYDDGEQGPQWTGEMEVWQKGADRSRRSDVLNLPIANVGSHGSGESDAAAIASAPTDVQALLQEITRLNACLQYEQHRTGRQGTHAEGCYKWGPGHWDCAVQEIERLRGQASFDGSQIAEYETMIRTQAQEIVKRDRMLERLIDKLIEDIAECPSGENCSVNFEGKSDNESNEICRKCWRKWIEKEAEVQGWLNKTKR